MCLQTIVEQFTGAVVGIRTRDLILTMDALYQLSYDGVTDAIITDGFFFVKVY